LVCLWSGTVGNLKEIVQEEKLGRDLSNEFTAFYGQPSRSLVNSWEKSFAALTDTLTSSEFDPLNAVLELQMPIGSERADAVLLGGQPQAPKGYVLELKQWSEALVDPQTEEITVPNFGRHQHPSLQVLNYVGKLHLFNSRAAAYQLKGGVFLHNMSAQSKARLLQGVDFDWLQRAPLFSGDESDALANSVSDYLLPGKLKETESSELCEAPFEQTRHLFDIITEHAPQIARRVESVLAESGEGLTEEQFLLSNDILSAMRQNSNTAFIVQGGPGSGKTLLAVTLLLRGLEEHRRCILALRNNRLQAILRRCFDLSYRGASGLMTFFEPRFGDGIGKEGFNRKFDLVIVDEAQRMEERIMPLALSHAPVYAIFLDETQRLNPPEEGTVSAFEKTCQQLGKTAEKRLLSEAVRCRGGIPYQRWVERMLQDPADLTSLKLSSQPWSKNYAVHFCGTVLEMIKKLVNVMEVRRDVRVALVASFTESPGNSRVNHPENVRVGYPLTSGWDFYDDSDVEVRWLMKPEEYVRFWMKGASNKLDHCASIYGAQGFESDFVGVIWGRDMTYSNNQWTLGEPRFCYDTTDRLVNRRGGIRWSPGALELVKNRYRIFMTRGIKGTFVFCEDDATREHLLNLETVQ
jgi:uncharacterized protein